MTALCNPDEPWSPRLTFDAVLDLELGSCSYFVNWGKKLTNVRKAGDAGGRYLRTDYDDSERNNLLDLPDTALV